uniref:Uncharacterized protein n=1 Tax=Sinocyclocheilus grahami TaxID=75366 RepID=A0A672KGQ1_SINGR
MTSSECCFYFSQFPIPILSHTYTLAKIHLQAVCELWCSLPQHCYALTWMATSSHHALFCVEPMEEREGISPHLCPFMWLFSVRQSPDSERKR